MTENNMNTAIAQENKNKPESKPALKLSTLKEVSVEELWKDGQHDFADWLEQNMDTLNEAIDLSLVDVQKKGGDFTAHDKSSKSLVLVESQFSCSTNNNLGRIITHASNANANAVIWIVTQAREEHKSAFRYLNNVTGNKTDFYLLEIRAFRIGNAAHAIKFEIAERPNERKRKDTE